MTTRRIDPALFPSFFPFGSQPGAVRQRIETMERLLEGLFVVPGINQRVGLDAIVGLVPVAGDAITAALGLYIVWEARQLGLPRWKIARMIANVGFDFAIGVVPIVGDALDFMFRSNTLNLKIIKRHLDQHHPASAVVKG